MRTYYSVENPVVFRKHFCNINGGENLLYDEKLLDYLSKFESFKEQIRVSNSELYKNYMDYLKDKSSFSKKRTRHLIESITGYFLRIKYRNTPFGLFSGVGVVNEKQYLENSHLKKIVLGYGWKYNVIQMFETKYQSNVKYVFENNMTDINENPFFLGIGKESNIIDGKYYDDEIGFKITKNSLTEMLESFLNKPRSINDIFNVIKEKYKNVDSDYIEEYITSLIDKKIVKSTLHSSLSQTDEEWLETIKGFLITVEDSQFMQKFEKLESLIQSYSITNIGEGIDTFDSISKCMNDIYQTQKDDLNVDLYLNDSCLSVTNDNLSDLNKCMDMLTKISIPYNELHAYTSMFLDKFGMDVEVPLYELIDKNSGIGFPKYDSSDNYSTQKETLESIGSLFDEKLYTALINNEPLTIDQSIVNDIQSILNRSDNHNDIIPRSMDVCLTQESHNSKISFTISEIFGSPLGSSITGRFRLLDNLYQQNKDTAVSDEFITCDINALPNLLSLSTLTQNRHFNKYEMSIGTNGNPHKNQISLNDLLVGYENDSLYLRYSKNNKIVRFVDYNMLNGDLKSPVIKLLLAISNTSNRWPFNFPWSFGQPLRTVIPEIICNNVIISPLTWNIKTSLYDNNFDNFYNEFINKIDSLKVPQLFYFVESDNKIVSNRKKESIYNIYKHLKKSHSKTAKLQKCEFDSLNDYGKSQEIVVTLKNNYKYQKSINQKPIYRSHEYLKPLNVDNGWFYVEIEFGDVGIKNEFIIQELSKINKEVNDCYDLFFFIQYENRYNPTIRLRWKSKDIFIVQTRITKYLDSLIKEGAIKNYTSKNYFRELDRYGGKQNIDKAEQAFYYDTIFAIDSFQNNPEKFEKESMAIYSCVSMLLSISSSINTIIDFLNIYDYPHNISKNASIWIRKNERAMDEYLKNVTKETKLLLDKRNSKIKDIISYDENQVNIVSSFLHMSINRLLGTDRYDEQQIMGILLKLFNKAKYTNNITGFQIHQM
ncbi:lantibiotic dehydratase [Apilactobacillus kunkeei]|uniref:thiopeptide-type bacteriocin biosynthesis protein n=1 Tax=Apilactobacillus kunkeei TaxID=148814 RepID=UPI00200A4D51|nr:thiopeptide-type bacteriocin biosynthesis protein [Apilactobacillus kunkeei]MCK8635992.1 lantibiotic dehydratase [Apilactobacillus kunkeei]